MSFSCPSHSSQISPGLRSDRRSWCRTTLAIVSAESNCGRDLFAPAQAGLSDRLCNSRQERGGVKRWSDKGFRRGGLRPADGSQGKGQLAPRSVERPCDAGGRPMFANQSCIVSSSQILHLTAEAGEMGLAQETDRQKRSVSSEPLFWEDRGEQI
jgi:hypothetical protein